MRTRAHQKENKLHSFSVLKLQNILITLISPDFIPAVTLEAAISDVHHHDHLGVLLGQQLPAVKIEGDT